MATTGFWPIKDKLSGLIAYIENPEKTGSMQQVDKDLYAAVKYVGDLEKTDKALYVDSINCPVATAYEHMMATKRRFGKLGGNVAYHGYQSFAAGEITPEEALEIGRQTAREMWGDQYEVLIAVHLNTDNLHCHFLVNSVSFRDGRKFGNHVKDHRDFRDISDRICWERGKSVLKDSEFYSKGKKKEYWVHRSGGLTHRDMLKRDLDEAISRTTYWSAFYDYMKGLGYSFPRDGSYAHPTIIAPGWKRPIRIDKLGPQYTMDAIKERLIENQYDPALYAVRIYKPKRSPLLELERELNYEISHSKDTAIVLVEVLFLILLQLLKLVREDGEILPHSPQLRQALSRYGQLQKEYFFLKHNNLHTEKDLLAFIGGRENEIAALEQERQSIRNSNRRPKDAAEREEKNAAAREISGKLKPLRDELKTAKSAYDRYPAVWELLRTERDMEIQALEKQHNKQRERKYER